MSLDLQNEEIGYVLQGINLKAIETFKSLLEMDSTVYRNDSEVSTDLINTLLAQIHRFHQVKFYALDSSKMEPTKQSSQSKSEE